MTEETKRTWRVRSRGVGIVTVVLLGAAFLFYWLLAREVQAINFRLTPTPGIENTLRTFPLLEPLLLLFELMSLSVLRHLFPLVFGFICAWFVTVELVQILYDLPTQRNAQLMLGRLFTGAGKPVKLDRRTFAEQRVNDELIRTGGPGQVIVGESDVVVTEINGRYERVLGAGKQRLRRFEEVIALLDLREQERASQSITLMTREGLELKTDLRLIFRLQQRSDATRPDAAYMFDDDSIRRAAYANEVTEDGITRWDDLPAAIAASQLRKIVASKRLDALIDPNKVFQGDPHPQIQIEMEQNTRDILRNYGIHLVSARLSALQMSPELHETLVAYWKAFGEKTKVLDEHPQHPDFDKANLQRSQAREKMISSLTSGLQTIRERKNAAPRREPKPVNNTIDPNQLLTLQMIRLLKQITPPQQNQTALPQPPEQLTAGSLPVQPERDELDIYLDNLLRNYLPPSDQ